MRIERDNDTFASILSGIQNNRVVKIDLRGEELSIAQLQRLNEVIQHNNSVGHIYWGELPEGQIAKNLVKGIEARIIQNNKNYRHYPKDYVYGLLSSFTYNTSTEGSEVKLNDISKDRHLKGWKVYKVSNDKENSGYYGAIYINEADNHLVLAHRGTDFTVREILSRDSGFRTDLRAILGGQIVAQQAIAYVITKEAVEYARANGYTFSITGHSLGAWLAELSAILCHLEFEYYDVKAVTFDSPGSLPLLKKFKSNVRNSETEIDPKNIDITTYLSAPNIVNSCNGHAGRVYRVFPRLEIPGWLSRMPSPERFHSAVGHLLSVILNEFDPETGRPRKYEKVLDWPCMKYKKEQSQGGAIGAVAERAGSMFIPRFGQPLFNLAMRGVRRVVGDHTITSVVDVLSDVISGNIDISQYWDLFNYINYQESLSARTNLSERERFYLGYKNHYRTKAINHKEEMLSRDRNKLEDSYILKLKKYKRGLLSDEVLSEIVKCQLEEIIGLYDIRRKHSRLHIITFGELSVEEIKERVKRIIHLAPEIEECINELKSGIRVNSSPSARVALYDVMDSPTMREGVVDTIQVSRDRVLSSFMCSFNSLFHGREDELKQLKTARLYFQYQTIEGRVANVYLDIEPDIQKLYNEKFFDINGQNKISWLRELLERNPQAIMNAALTNRDGERLELNSIVLNLPRFNSDQLISYISEWIKYGFGKVSKPGPYNIMHSNRGAVEFSSLFKGAMGELRELKGARIYFEYEEQDTKKTLYLDAEPDIKRLYNEGHFDHAGHNKIEWLRELLQRNSQAIKDAYITNNEGCPIEIEGVTLNFPISSDILVNYISEWIRYAFTNNNKPRGFNNHNPELTREAEERSNTGLRFKDLFRGPEEELSKLKTKDIHFYYRVEGRNTLNYLYLNINPDLKKLYNQGHFDFYGENRLEWLRSQLNNNPGFIQGVEIKDGRNEAVTSGSSERGLINLNLIRTCLPRDINDPVIRYITDWIRYGFDTSRSKPGEFSEGYASRISPINNRDQFRSAVSPMDSEEQREDRGSRGI